MWHCYRFINDQRYVTALGVLLGVDLQTVAQDGGMETNFTPLSLFLSLSLSLSLSHS